MAVRKTCVLVLDSATPEDLAEFYAGLLGATSRLSKNPDYIEIFDGEGICLAIHREHGYTPASWPRPEDSQQAHLRILVPREDMDEAEREAIGLGARPVDAKDNTGPRDTRTYTDTAGHSFTLAASI